MSRSSSPASSMHNIHFRIAPYKNPNKFIAVERHFYLWPFAGSYESYASIGQLNKQFIQRLTKKKHKKNIFFRNFSGGGDVDWKKLLWMQQHYILTFLKFLQPVTHSEKRKKIVSTTMYKWGLLLFSWAIDKNYKLRYQATMEWVSAAFEFSVQCAATTKIRWKKCSTSPKKKEKKEIKSLFDGFSVRKWIYGYQRKRRSKNFVIKFNFVMKKIKSFLGRENFMQ